MKGSGLSTAPAGHLNDGRAALSSDCFEIVSIAPHCNELTARPYHDPIHHQLQPASAQRCRPTDVSLYRRARPEFIQRAKKSSAAADVDGPCRRVAVRSLQPRLNGDGKANGFAPLDSAAVKKDAVVCGAHYSYLRSRGRKSLTRCRAVGNNLLLSCLV